MSIHHWILAVQPTQWRGDHHHQNDCQHSENSIGGVKKNQINIPLYGNEINLKFNYRIRWDQGSCLVNMTIRSECRRAASKVGRVESIWITSCSSCSSSSEVSSEISSVSSSSGTSLGELLEEILLVGELMVHTGWMRTRQRLTIELWLVIRMSEMGNKRGR